MVKIFWPYCLRHKKNKQPCLDTVSSVTPVLCLFQFLTLLLCLKDSRPFTCCLPRCLRVCIYLKGKCTCVCETDRQAHQNSSPLSVTASIWQWNYFGIWKLNAPHSVKKKNTLSKPLSATGPRQNQCHTLSQHLCDVKHGVYEITHGFRDWFQPHNVLHLSKSMRRQSILPSQRHTKLKIPPSLSLMTSLLPLSLTLIN